MPLIDAILPRCIFYLYQNETAARNREQVGGTGFFVGVESKKGNKFFYAVTNRHVIDDGDGHSAPVISFNSEVEGVPEIIPYTKKNWFHHLSGADVSIALIDTQTTNYNFSAIPVRWFATKEIFDPADPVFLLGEDVYMVGRFIMREGKTANMPTARSGIISALPDEKEKIPLFGQQPQEAFLIEMRSLAGYSGSPVMCNLRSAEFMNNLMVSMSVIYQKEVPDGSRFNES